MCGIAGYFSPGGLNAEQAAEVLTGMTCAIAHRGPDDYGIWSDESAGIALGHRRLSIIDLSPLGHQPMWCEGGRFVIVFNGEIYNFKELRAELEGHGVRFRGTSDTEVMLAAVARWGVRSAVERFNGMFAFAVWDREERLLHLSRDRGGEKPLYYALMGGELIFGSELKALRAHPSFRGVLNRDALALYLRHNYVPAPYSIYADVHKLPAGSLLTLSADDVRRGRAEPEAYWSMREVAEEGVRNPFAGSDAEAVVELDRLLRSAVRMRMEADVPLGAFLSGGIDSSLIVALMQAQSARPVKTFTIGFNEAAYNEAVHAKAVAQHLGTEHTELYVTPQQAMDVIPRLPTLYDEPFSDSSQIPTFLVSSLAREHVTVSLSGDAGDELFAGYNRYSTGREVWEKVSRVPLPLRLLFARALSVPSATTWDRAFRLVSPLAPHRLRGRSAGDRARQLAQMFSARAPEAMYRGLVTHWDEPTSVVRGSREPLTALTDRSRWAELPDLTRRMMYLDSVSYLPDDILVKVDRASMGVSLESRVPLLDPRVIEFAWRLPDEMKVRDGVGKWLLRQVLYQYVPRELIDRPKMGFGVPIDAWLRGPLRGWAEELLDEDRMRAEGIFDPAPIRRRWREHLEGRRDWHYLIWDVLMFQAWNEQQGEPAAWAARRHPAPEVGRSLTETRASA